MPYLLKTKEKPTTSHNTEKTKEVHKNEKAIKNKSLKHQIWNPHFEEPRYSSRSASLLDIWILPNLSQINQYFKTSKLRKYHLEKRLISKNPKWEEIQPRKMLF